MWLERFNIIVISLHRDFIPGSWSMYAPTIVDISLFVGTICFFGMNFLLFLRFVPSVAASEIKELAHEMRHKTWLARSKSRASSSWPASSEPERMLVAAKRMRETVKGEVETYTPYPMHGIDEALGLPKSIIPKMVGTGALFGVLRRLHAALLVLGHRLPDQRRRPPAALGAGVHPDHVRVRRSALGADGVLRRAGVDGLSAAVPPGVRGAGLPPRHRSTASGSRSRSRATIPTRCKQELKELGAEETDFVTEQLQ